MNTNSTLIASLVAAALACSAVAMAASSLVAVKPQAAIAKAAALTPPADAKKTKTAGKGKTQVNTANSPDDDDAMWVENIDIDSDGNVDVTDVVWDDEDKVVFYHTSDTFTCAHGGTGEGDLLIGVNAKGNTRGRPAGSGFYVVSLDKSECRSEEVSLFGCKFDAAGNETACGAATLDEANDDIVIVTASR